ncbi:MAG: hypothetical protein AAGE98_08795 [Actinomycetota bacterium]
MLLLAASCAATDGDTAEVSASASEPSAPEPSASGPATTAASAPGATNPPTSSSSPTTTSATTTTTTIDPTSASIICGSGTPLLEPDLDGDGDVEGVFLVERAGGQSLYLCDGPIVNDRALDLEYGVWYVGATDLDVDGIDDLFLGASTLADQPATPDAWWLPVDTSGPELSVVINDSAPPADVSLDELGAVRVAPPAAICEADGQSGFPSRVDLDGDGLDDLVVQGRLDHGWELVGEDGIGSPSVVACLATGEVDELAYGGMGEIFGVGTGPGGEALVWTGGTTVNAAVVFPVVWRDGRLDFVRRMDGEVLVLTNGFPFAEPGGEVARYGCGDADGDGVAEFVQVRLISSDGIPEWERTAWRLVDGRADEVWADAGSLTSAPDEDDFDALGDLVPDTCEGADG